MDYQIQEGNKRKYNTISAAPYQDEYSGFSWKGQHSSEYNCFIENTGHLSFVPAPTFSNNFVNPAFQAHSYFTGTSMQSKKLTLNLVFYQIRLDTLNKALAWLNPLDTGEFVLDYSPLWKYVMKLSSIDVIEKYVAGKARIPMLENRSEQSYYLEDLYICKANISFETVFNYEALSRYTLNGNFDYSASNNNRILVNYIPVDYSNTDAIINDSNNYNTRKTSFTCSNNINISNNYKYINPSNYQTLPFYLFKDSDGNENVRLKNNSSIDVPFTFEFYNLHNGFTIIDEDSTSKSIVAQAQLSLLEKNQFLNLTYDSETGAITCANRLLQEIKGSRGKFLSEYVISMSNQIIPAHGTRTFTIHYKNDAGIGENVPCPDPDNEGATISHDILASYAVYFNNYEYVL